MRILCLDFDGVIHQYTSKWEGPTRIPDPPVPGVFDFMKEATKHFEIHIFSSRSHQPGGIRAMKDWLLFYLHEEYVNIPYWCDFLHWPETKPPAFLTIDDRALTFTGVWPLMKDLQAFKPWNKS